MFQEHTERYRFDLLGLRPVIRACVNVPGEHLFRLGPLRLGENIYGRGLGQTLWLLVKPRDSWVRQC